MTDFDLKAFQARRDAALENDEKWPCSAGELLAAYAAGERNFLMVDLRFANLRFANLREANLSEANLSAANLSAANLSEANLRFANLRFANLREANLSEANLSEANLSAANLSAANLYKADLYKADLSEANLREANLREADLPAGFYVLQIGPVGSRRDYVCAVSDCERQELRTGCFCGTLDEFVAAVERKPDGDPYRVEYETLVIPALKAFFALHKVSDGEQR